ncbi:hypothetical protein SpCBS45565_g01995 [Spizellomyces sp. 'palustris']|nr:hypothetical protein SpCBS45565_g01995 [Spizellomyces sp. 'palustris']
MALTLSGMLINDKKITVHLLSEVPPGGLAASHSKYAELLASGVLRAERIDERFGITDTASGIATRVQGLDERLGVTSTAQKVADLLKVKECVGMAVSAASSVGGKALKTSIGQRIHTAYESVKENVIEIAEDTMTVLEEKKRSEAVSTGENLNAGDKGIAAPSSRQSTPDEYPDPE